MGLSHKLKGKEFNQYYSGYNLNTKNAMRLQLEAAGISVEKKTQKTNAKYIFKCDNCNRKFRTEGIQKNHMKVCNEKPSSVNFVSTVHKCDYCYKTFKNLGSLKFHTAVCIEKPRD